MLSTELLTPVSGTSELQAQLDAVRQELETMRQPDLGSMAALQQDNLAWLTFNTSPSPVPTAVGTLAWDGGTTLGVQMTANVLGRVNESGYYYIKASSAITKGDVVMFTGAVGASGVPTGAPATGVTDGSYIMGVATQDIANNGWGYVTNFGLVRGIDTTGGGEAWVDGQILYYNPNVPGALTKTEPTPKSLSLPTLQMGRLKCQQAATLLPTEFRARDHVAAKGWATSQPH